MENKEQKFASFEWSRTEIVGDSWARIRPQIEGGYISTIAIVGKGFVGAVAGFQKLVETEHYLVYELSYDAKEYAEQEAKKEFGDYLVGLLTFQR